MKARLNIARWIFLVAGTIVLASCAQPTAPDVDTSTSADTTAKSDGGEVQWVDPNDIQLAPIQRDSLTDAQMERVRALQKVFVEVDGQSVDQWVDNFKRDLNPDQELAVWEKMSMAYTSDCADRELDLESKKEVYRVVLLRLMASESDVLARLELKRLSKDDAVEIMRAF